MKKDKIHKKDHRVWIRWKGQERTIMDVQQDSMCPLTDRQLRRRIREYILGNSNMTVDEVITKPIVKPAPAKPRDRAKEAAKLVVKRSEEEEWEMLRNSMARSTLFSPRLQESARYRKMAESLA